MVQGKCRSYLPHDGPPQPPPPHRPGHSFKRYRTLVSEALFDKYDAVEHWAKVEPPEDAAELEALRQRLGRRFPVAAFQAARRRLDPKNILSNDWVNALFPLPQTEEAGDSDEGQPAARAEAA